MENSGWFFDVHCVEEVALLLCGLAGSGEGSLSGGRCVLLNAGEDVEGGSWACGIASGFEAHAHDAVEDECEEADHGVGANAVGQTVMRRCDLDVGFENAEAALDVCEALVARDGLGGREIGGVGDQGELPVEKLGLCESAPIDGPAEAVGGVVGLDEAGEFGLGDSAGETAVGSTVGGAAPLCSLAIVLGIELADHPVGHGLQFGDAGAAGVALLGGAPGIMGHDEAMTGEGGFSQPALIEGERAEGIRQFRVAASGNGDDELQLAPALFGQPGCVFFLSRFAAAKPASTFAAKRSSAPIVSRLRSPRSATRMTRCTGKRCRTVVSIACRVFVSAALPGWTVCMRGRPSAVCTTPSTNCSAIPPVCLFMPKARMSSSTFPSPWMRTVVRS